MNIITDASHHSTVTGLGYSIDGDVDHTIVADESLGSVEAELLAVYEALRIASQTYDGAITILTDCQPAVNVMKGDGGAKWKDWRESFYWLSKKFSSYEIRCVSRDRVEVAHDEARLGVRKHSS